VPVVAPPSVVTKPPAPPSGHSAGRPLPVVTGPQPERGDLEDDESD
jgi:hypothetical protein